MPPKKQTAHAGAPADGNNGQQPGNAQTQANLNVAIAAFAAPLVVAQHAEPEPANLIAARALVTAAAATAAAASTSASVSASAVAAPGAVAAPAIAGAGARRQNVPWNKDAAPGRSETSMDVLMECFDYEFYLAWTGASGTGISKESLAGDIVGRMNAVGIHHRTNAQVRAKISELEKSYRNAQDWISNTGQGVMEDENLSEEDKRSQIRGYVRKLCPHYDLLDDLMRDRHNSRPLATNEELQGAVSPEGGSSSSNSGSYVNNGSSSNVKNSSSSGSNVNNSSSSGNNFSFQPTNRFIAPPVSEQEWCRRMAAGGSLTPNQHLINRQEDRFYGFLDTNELAQLERDEELDREQKHLDREQELRENFSNVGTPLRLSVPNNSHPVGLSLSSPPGWGGYRSSSFVSPLGPVIDGSHSTAVSSFTLANGGSPGHSLGSLVSSACASNSSLVSPRPAVPPQLAGSPRTVLSPLSPANTPSATGSPSQAAKNAAGKRKTPTEKWDIAEEKAAEIAEKRLAIDQQRLVMEMGQSDSMRKKLDAEAEKAKSDAETARIAAIMKKVEAKAELRRQGLTEVEIDELLN
ncbi:hypothetical protein HDU98_004038 [Podochytrium sp. JEL0797]|nr:hypothetical protein HDU98_004038 [Podochytrium sp. JEL0797]